MQINTSDLRALLKDLSHAATVMADTIPEQVGQTPEDLDNLIDAIMSDMLGFMIKVTHERNIRAGWWSDIETGEAKPRNVGEILMLKVTEIAEAMEGHRKGAMSTKLPHRNAFEVEVADMFIRGLDTAGANYAHGKPLLSTNYHAAGYVPLDVAGAFRDKLAFNRQRPDHKIENRLKADGKKY